MSNPSPISEVSESSVAASRGVRLGVDRWYELIEAHGHSGLSVASFCREQGLSASSFYKWRHRFAHQAPGIAARFVRLDPSGPLSDRVELILPDGVVLRVPVSCLSQVVRLVYRDAPC